MKRILNRIVYVIARIIFGIWRTIQWIVGVILWACILILALFFVALAAQYAANWYATGQCARYHVSRGIYTMPVGVSCLKTIEGTEEILSLDEVRKLMEVLHPPLNDGS